MSALSEALEVRQGVEYALPLVQPVREAPAPATIVRAPRPTVAAVIVSWRTGPRLFQCLESVLSAPDVDEVILVDNGNPRETRNRLLHAAALHKEFRIIWGHGNVGFGAGCNLGARHATSDRLLFLNPDASVTPGVAAELADVGETQMRPWIVGGRVLGLDGREQRGARRGDMTPWSTFVEVSGLRAFGRVHPAFRSVHLEDEPAPFGPQTMPTVSGACMMMRADDFHALGGFDEGYFIHVEDVDICRRVRELGGSVAFAPDAVVEHEGATSPASRLRVGWHKGRGFARYFKKFARTPVGQIGYTCLSPLIVLAALAHSVMKPAQRHSA